MSDRGALTNRGAIQSLGLHCVWSVSKNSDYLCLVGLHCGGEPLSGQALFQTVSDVCVAYVSMNRCVVDVVSQNGLIICGILGGAYLVGAYLAGIFTTQTRLIGNFGCFRARWCFVLFF